MLHFSGRKMPDHIFVHGFLTVSGEKMSKSRGTGISPLRYLELGLNPEWLRYYIAAKLNARVEDIDFNPDDFVARVNATWSASTSTSPAAPPASWASASAARCRPTSASRAARCSTALRAQRDAIADAVRGARLRQGAARDHAAGRPRQRVRRPAQALGTGQEGRRRGACCTTSARVCIEAFRLLTIYLKPVLPALAAQVEAFLQRRAAALRRRRARARRAHDRRLQAPDAARRPKLLDALFERRAGRRPAAGARCPAARRSPPRSSIDDFAKIDLRIAKIVDCERVEGSTKLLRLTLDVGEGQHAQRLQRHRVGLRARADLVGKLHRDGRQPGAAQDEVRRQRRHGAGRRHADEKADPGALRARAWPGATPGMRVR